MANMEARLITFYIIIVASTFFSIALTEVINFGKCGDEECSEPVAEGITIHRYSAPDEDLVSFQPNVKVKIFSKKAGEKSDLIGIEVNGNRGYAPENFIKEMKKIKEVKFPAKKKFNLWFEPSVTSSFNSSLNHAEDVSSHEQSIFVNTTESNNEGKSAVRETDIKYESSLVENDNSPTNVPVAKESSERTYVPGSDALSEKQGQFVDNSKILNGVEVSSDISEQKVTSILSEEQKAQFAKLDQNDVTTSNAIISPSIVSTASNQEHGSFSNIPSPPNSLDEVVNHQFGHKDIPVSKELPDSKVVRNSLNFEGETNSVPITSNQEHSSVSDILSPRKSLDDVVAHQSNHEDIPVNKELPDTIFVGNSLNSESETNSVPLTSSFHSEGFSDAASEQSNEYHSTTDIMMTSEVDASMQIVPSVDQSETSSKTKQSEETLPWESLNTDTINSVKVVLHETIDKLKTSSKITHSNSIEDDMAKTLAILEKQGITNPYLYDKENEVENVMLNTDFNNGLYADSTQNVEAKIHTSKLNYVNPIVGYKSLHINSVKRNSYVAKHHKKTEISASNEPQSALNMLTNSNENDYDGEIEQVEHDTNENKKQPVCHDSQKTDNTCKNFTENNNNKKNRDSTGNYNTKKDDIHTNLPKNSKEYDNTKQKAAPSTHISLENTKSIDYSTMDVSQSTEQLVSPPSADVQQFGKIATFSDQNNLDASNIEQNSFEQIQSNTEETKHFNKYEIPATSTISHSLVNTHIHTSRVMPNSEPNTELLNSPSTQNDHKEQTLETSVNETIEHEISTLNEHEPAESELLDEDIYASTKVTRNNEELTSTESYYNSRQLKSEADSLIEGNQEMYSSNEENFYTLVSLSFCYETVTNGIAVLRSFMQSLIVLLPEPFQTFLIDLESQGVSPRLTVFTVISAVFSILLVVAYMYMKKRSKEKNILAKVSGLEQKLFTTSTERDLLKEELGTVKNQLLIIQRNLEEEQASVSLLRSKLEDAENCSQNDNLKQKKLIENLKKEVESNLCSISDLQKAVKIAEEEKVNLQQKLQEEECTVSNISIQLQEIEEEARTLQKEKEKLTEMEENSKSRLTQLEQSCNQLLQEAEVWNARVNELTDQLENEKLIREELESGGISKDTEIKSLKNLIEHLELIQAVKDLGEGTGQDLEKQIEELMNASAIQVQLDESQKENENLSERLEVEKNKLLEMEVELLDVKSEAEKLKFCYNQALQDKTEAQTKLGVLTNYFKEKEVLLQKELGVQEAVRQQKEEDASSAERRIALIEEENSSYKYQIASLKQELEETERNFKNQVAVQEKRAHESWIAARAAERKAEEQKQEATQLRQRLTLLERQQESWTSASHDEIVRPVPKNIQDKASTKKSKIGFAGPNGEIIPNKQTLSQNTSSSSLEYPSTSTASMSNERIHPMPPMMLPPDRPLPPLDLLHSLPPPPFMPPMDHRVPPPYRPEPWHMPLGRHPDANYEQGRLSTPPRRHHSPPFFDREAGRHSSSPQEGNSRDSHSSSPQHPLPHFHDIPPPPRRPYDFPPPPPLHSRFPPPPRREPFIPGPLPIRTDSRNADMVTSTPRGAHQPTALQDKRQHQQPNTRV